MAKYRVALATQGTRGDFQPVLALGIGLADAGHMVKFFANPGHCEMAAEFNLDAAIIDVEIKDCLSSERGMKAMEQGDLILMGTAADDQEGDDTDWPEVFVREVSKFKPDVLIWTALVGVQVCLFKNSYPDVPDVKASLQPHCIPTNHISPISMQRVELEAHQPMISKWIMSAQAEGMQTFTEWRLAKSAGKEHVNLFCTPQATFESYFNVEELPSPILLAYSPGWWPPYDDWPKSNAQITGTWKITKERQHAAAETGKNLFSAGGDHLACVDFIRSCREKPVYIGWGSMMVYSKTHMARLAVGALKQAGRRGIIVGGWAELSKESLCEGDGDDDLKAFCDENILFLKAAPHEWLFPQCACCVHHGGIGTAQASLSAGVPTIVTPVFADQMDIAEKITKDGHGVGTVHLSKLNAKELGEKILECCGNLQMLQNCRNLADVMQKEEGVASTVHFLEDFMSQDVASGRWKKKQCALLNRLKAAAENFDTLTDPTPIFSSWNIDLAEKYPEVKKYTSFQVEMHSIMMQCLQQKKLWYVKSSQGCLARKGESLKTAECGRFKEFAILQEIGVNKLGSRLHVRRLRGNGPEEGWVTPMVSGKDIIVRVATRAECQKLQADAVRKQFADILPQEEGTQRLESRLM